MFLFHSPLYCYKISLTTVHRTIYFDMTTVQASHGSVQTLLNLSLFKISLSTAFKMAAAETTARDHCGVYIPAVVLGVTCSLFTNTQDTFLGYIL